jgi:magnesium transporter
MNQVMKVLTVIATIFMPMTFLAGVYGMNFKHFPELEWRWGYLVFWIINLVIVVVMLSFFKRKKWL